MPDETKEPTEETKPGEEAAISDEPKASEEPTEETKAADANWRDAITDADHRKLADRFDSVPAMVKAVADLQKRDGQVRVPGKDADEKELTAYYKAIGVPESAEGYEFAVQEGREINEADKAFQIAAAEKFHGLKITAEQAAGLNEWWNATSEAIQQAEIAEDKKYADASEAALKAEWPGAEYERNKVFADRAAADLFGDAIDAVREIETKDGRFVLDHADFIKALAKVGREMEEGRLGGVLSEGDKGGVETQIDELQAKIEKAQTSGDRGLANKLYQEQQELYRKIHGSGAIVGAEGRAA